MSTLSMRNLAFIVSTMVLQARADDLQGDFGSGDPQSSLRYGVNGCECQQQWEFTTMPSGSSQTQTLYVSTYCASGLTFTPMCRSVNSSCGAEDWLPGFDHCSAFPVTCDACVAEGGTWCAAAAACRALVPSSQELIDLGLGGVAELCQDAGSWTSDCVAVDSGRNAEDPKYDAQSWVYQMIDVEPIWEQGYSGRGVRMMINDDGIDLTSPDFAPLPDGTAKFDPLVSCLGNQSLPASHGTGCGAIAMANAQNGFCSRGIAPNSTFGQCLTVSTLGVELFSQAFIAVGASSIDDFFRRVLTYFLANGMDVIDISSNSWGPLSCPVKSDGSRRRRLSEGSDVDGCPFRLDVRTRSIAVAPIRSPP